MRARARRQSGLRKRGARRRAGMTLVETVAAVVLLSILASTVFGAISLLTNQQIRRQHLLGCAELANRLMLQYLDDPNSLPAAGLEIAYGADLYRWELASGPARLTPARMEASSQRAGRGGIELDRLNTITVHVWLSEESGGSARPGPGTPIFTVTRLVDPIADAYRNPDSSRNMLMDPEGRRRFLERFRSTESGGVMRSGPAEAAPAAPAPSRTQPGRGTQQESKPAGSGGRGGQEQKRDGGGTGRGG